MTLEEVMAELEARADATRAEGAARYGLPTQDRFGVAAPVLRALTERIEKDHALAVELWQTGMAEARVLACLVEDPLTVTAVQLERWARQINAWDLCDTFAGALVRPSSYAATAAFAWPARDEEFVKRAGFAIMASLAVHDRSASDRVFEAMLRRVVQRAPDERKLVKKGVSGALRQIGKRNPALRRAAIAAALRLERSSSAGARWAARDALRQLRGTPARTRVTRRWADPTPAARRTRSARA